MRLSPAQARRVALAATGLDGARPSAAVGRVHLRRVLGRLGLLQIDSVNVLQRAHYLPLFSRLGAYPTALLDEAAYGRRRELFEYWGHEASLLPYDLHPLLRWRMASGVTDAWGWMKRVAVEHPDVVTWVRREVTDRGPVTAAQVEADTPRLTEGQWGWNWSQAKAALEWLFWTGEVTAASRTTSFARAYDLAERVIPATVLARPTPSPAQAQRELVRVAATALGVATEADLRDYFRLPVAGTRQAVSELVEEGALAPVTIDGWPARTYLHTQARVPRSVKAATLVSPFDPLIWERARTERLFGFRYRIEIYTPAAKRVHGYYVLPFLLGDQLVARVDLKADRAAGVLRVPGAWVESAHADRPEVLPALTQALADLATWLDLDPPSPPPLRVDETT